MGNIVLVNSFGLNGVVFATLFTYLCISYPWVVKVLFKDYFKSRMGEYIRTVLFGSMLVLITGIITYFIVSLIHDNGVVLFCLKCFVCIILPNMIFIVTFGKKGNIFRTFKMLSK